MFEAANNKRKVFEPIDIKLLLQLLNYQKLFAKHAKKL